MKVILTLLKVLAICVAATSCQSSGGIYFRQAVTKCPMFTESCQFEALVSSDTKLESLTIKSNADETATFVSISRRENDDNSTDEGQNKSEFFKSLNLSQTEHEQRFTLHLVKFKSVLIGNASLQFYSSGKSEGNNSELDLIAEHHVLVVAPRRLIDILFDIYIWTSNSIISLCIECIALPLFSCHF
jgi:hypothetical protein